MSRQVIGGFLDPTEVGPWRSWPAFVNHSLHALRACSSPVPSSFDTSKGVHGYGSTANSSGSRDDSRSSSGFPRHNDAWHDCAFASSAGYSVLAYSDYFYQVHLSLAISLSNLLFYFVSRIIPPNPTVCTDCSSLLLKALRYFLHMDCCSILTDTSVARSISLN